MNDNKYRIIVIGLDGATWDLLIPLINNGDLPNIERLVNIGVKGTLISTLPPITGPAWASFSTGRNPGKHGIFDFYYLKDGKLYVHKSRDIKSPPIYETLSQSNIRSVIIGFPLSYPPSKSFKGIMISDFLYPHKSIYPHSKIKYINEYKITPDFSKKGINFFEDMIKTNTLQFNTVKKLFSKEEWQFFFYLFRETDTICHIFWREVFKEEMNETAKKIFKNADDMIGWIISKMQQNDILFIISDHGFGKNYGVFYLNSFLKKIGLLKTKLTLDYRISIKNILKRGRTIDLPKSPIILRFLRWTLNIEIIKKIFSIINLQVPFIMTKIRYTLKLLNIPFYTEVIDFEKSLAYMPTPETFGIFIKDNNILKDRLIKILKSMRFNNKKVFKEIFTKEEIYNGLYSDFGPDILFLPNNILVNPKISPLILMEDPNAFHKMDGIFIAYGNDFEQGLKLENISIYDLYPTILHLFNLEIPIDTDGHVLKKIFRKVTLKSKEIIKYEKEQAKINRSIKNLSDLKRI